MATWKLLNRKTKRMRNRRYRLAATLIYPYRQDCEFLSGSLEPAITLNTWDHLALASYGMVIISSSFQEVSELHFNLSSQSGDYICFATVVYTICGPYQRFERSYNTKSIRVEVLPPSSSSAYSSAWTMDASSTPEISATPKASAIPATLSPPRPDSETRSNLWFCNRNWNFVILCIFLKILYSCDYGFSKSMYCALRCQGNE